MLQYKIYHLHIKDYIDQNFNKKISLDELSEKFYINKFYLTRIFKEQFGVSINSYIQQVKITNAKKLLRFSNLTIDEISYRCGIDDSNYFSRMFKKIEHLTPNQYRKLW
ncbi:MAG: helix-turn-helix transcriptional regulator [Lachnospirales bacterium]